MIQNSETTKVVENTETDEKQKTNDNDSNGKEFNLSHISEQEKKNERKTNEQQGNCYW